jgi:hypothetical protein
MCNRDGGRLKTEGLREIRPAPIGVMMPRLLDEAFRIESCLVP